MIPPIQPFTPLSSAEINGVEMGSQHTITTTTQTGEGKENDGFSSATAGPTVDDTNALAEINYAPTKATPVAMQCLRLPESFGGFKGGSGWRVEGVVADGGKVVVTLHRSVSAGDEVLVLTVQRLHPITHCFHCRTPPRHSSSTSVSPA